MPTGRCDKGNALTELPSSQVALLRTQLTRTNQPSPCVSDTIAKRMNYVSRFPSYMALSFLTGFPVTLISVSSK